MKKEKEIHIEGSCSRKEMENFLATGDLTQAIEGLKPVIDDFIRHKGDGYEAIEADLSISIILRKETEIDLTP